MNIGLPFLLVLLLAVSCKNKKKASDLSDPQQVSQDIESEMKNADAEATYEEPSLSTSEQLSQYFQAIASASSIPEANNNINEALTMFSTSEAVVLIEIYNSNGQVDYDEPTTISRYLNYLKDQKKNMNKVQDIVYDGNGKVKELVLRKYL
ncbi:nucleoid-structuring protein H-NS [Marinoscillum sp. MHG1-6]|uniref:nucleoid-structuring protein H-NS n=1 Tax=Marinoscillum sp. MHG1-6 TaxID=2959627 RepID=UPI0021588242|nr:nucleoid-structuring protein H-NS [Marinoscillum sp. MHG1-6]